MEQKLRSLVVALLALASCGGSSSPFTGGWSGSCTLSSPDCGDGGSTNCIDRFTLIESNGGLTYTTTVGCSYDFSVTGDTATLSNAPVSCNTTINGVATALSITSYTMRISRDGADLTTNVTIRSTTASQTCTQIEMGSLTKQ